MLDQVLGQELDGVGWSGGAHGAQGGQKLQDHQLVPELLTVQVRHGAWNKYFFFLNPRISLEIFGLRLENMFLSTRYYVSIYIYN